MTYEEAKDKCISVVDFENGINNGNELERLVIQALDKQIEKKPVLKKADWDGQIYEICPICGNQIRIAGHMMAEYCCMCGQAIEALDWSEEE
ncbi:MAG: hypothetical protein KBS59_00300 [Clostridiales bacterium]|nr:hypothetical protein [Clostridiales bacterium]